MSYGLGVDLGTTFTSASIYADGQATAIPLSSERLAAPSAVFVNGDGRVALGGDAAARGARDPVGLIKRVVHRFLRHLPGAVVVKQVERDSPAWKAGLRPGTLISHVDGQRVAQPDGFYEAVRRIPGAVELNTFDLSGRETVVVP